MVGSSRTSTKDQTRALSEHHPSKLPTLRLLEISAIGRIDQVLSPRLTKDREDDNLRGPDCRGVAMASVRGHAGGLQLL